MKRGQESIPLLGTNAHCVRSLADSGNRLLSGRTKVRRLRTAQPIRKRICVRADDDTLSVVMKTPRSPSGRTKFVFNAEIAQQAEQPLRKQHVVGSSPTLGSIVFLALVAERPTKFARSELERSNSER